MPNAREEEKRKDFDDDAEIDPKAIEPGQTYLIAPDDYLHIYCKDQNTIKKDGSEQNCNKKIDCESSSDDDDVGANEIDQRRLDELDCDLLDESNGPRKRSSSSLMTNKSSSKHHHHHHHRHRHHCHHRNRHHQHPHHHHHHHHRPRQQQTDAEGKEKSQSLDRKTKSSKLKKTKRYDLASPEIMKSSKERFDRYDHIRREQTLSRKRFKHQPNRNRKSKTGKKLRSPSPMEIGAAVRKQSSSKNVPQQPEESLGRKSLNEIDSAPTALIAPDDYLHIYKREKN